MLFVDVRERRNGSSTVEDHEESHRRQVAWEPSVGTAGSLVILRSFCRIPGHRLIYGRMRLFPEWLVLSGMGIKGRYHRRIALADVEQVDWFENAFGNSTLLLHTSNEKPIRVCLRRAGLWKYAIEERLSSRAKTVAATLARRRGQYIHRAIYCA